MDDESIRTLILIVVCLLFSAFFSAAETAMTSLNKIRLRAMVDDGVKGAKTVQTLLESSNKLLSTILVANNVFNILISSLSTALAIRLFNGNVAIGIATGSATALILIFGEVTPKTYAIRYSEKISLLFAPLLMFFVFMLKPFVFIMDGIVAFLLFILGAKKGGDSPTVTEEDLKAMVNVSHEEGVLEIEERKMIENVFDFRDSQLGAIMTPRINVALINENSDYETVINFFRDHSYSRVPVQANASDEILGIINIKDIALSQNAIENFSVSKFLRPAFYAYEFNNTAKVFAELRKSNSSFVVVLDEYGVMAGIVTKEDFVEEIVGDILDEYDDKAEEFQISEDSFVVDGTLSLDDFNDLCHSDIESDDFDSIGGLVLGLTGKLPDIGDCVEKDNVIFTIQSIENNRISKLHVKFDNGEKKDNQLTEQV